jgi:hypothetical protein
MNDTTSAPVFTCACIGCRKRPLNLYQGMNDSHLFAEIARGGSYYFTPDTRRFFGSRLLGHRVIDGGVIVTESVRAGFDLDAGRIYKVTLWCPFGNVEVSDYRPASARALRVWAWSDGAQDWARCVFAACECHGCQIARVQA